VKFEIAKEKMHLVGGIWRAIGTQWLAMIWSKRKSWVTIWEMRNN